LLGAVRRAWTARAADPGSRAVRAGLDGQFVGHAIEGRRPAFFDNIVQLLIGPAWLVGKLMRRLGIAY
jgi:uncharacterized membrane protein YGL010W